MADTHDTTDGLLAEFRGYAAGMPPSYHVTMSWADFRKMLDRLDAAHKREVAVSKTETPTNAVKLREALAAYLALWDNGTMNNLDELKRVIKQMREALSAPPRNCDMPLVVDGPADNNADKAWLVFKRHNPDAYFDVPGLLRCIDWLFAPATEKEGGKDADE